MTTVKNWTDDEVSEEISLCVRKACESDRHIYERLTELLKKSETVEPKSSGKQSIPKAESTTDDDSKKTPKRRRGYWGDIEEDGEE